MHMLQAGVAKSGNYWLWRITTELLAHAGIPKTSFITHQPIYHSVRERTDLSHTDQAVIEVIDIVQDAFYWRFSSIHKEQIADISAYAAQCTQIWTHSPWASGCNLLLQHVDKAIYIIRDPRDVAVSMANFAFTPYMREYFPHKERSVEEYLDHRLEWHTRNWVQHVSGWLANGGDRVHPVFYERLKSDLPTELQKLATYLELPLDDSALRQVAAAVSVASMKERGPNHVRDARSGGWRNVLSARHLASVNKVAGPLLHKLGYALDAASPSAPLTYPGLQPACADIYRGSGYGVWEAVRAAAALLTSRRTLSDKLGVIKRQLAARQAR